MSLILQFTRQLLNLFSKRKRYFCHFLVTVKLSILLILLKYLYLTLVVYFETEMSYVVIQQICRSERLVLSVIVTNLVQNFIQIFNFSSDFVQRMKGV